MLSHVSHCDMGFVFLVGFPANFPLVWFKVLVGNCSGSSAYNGRNLSMAMLNVLAIFLTWAMSKLGLQMFG